MRKSQDDKRPRSYLEAFMSLKVSKPKICRFNYEEILDKLKPNNEKRAISNI